MMAIRLSKKYGNIHLPAILCQDACQGMMLHPYIMPQEQAAKTSMFSEVRIQVFSFMYSLEVCG